MVISVKKEVNKKNKKKKQTKQIKKKVDKIIKQIKKTDYKKIKSIVINFIKKNNYLLIMPIPFILIDIITRILGQKIDFYSIFGLVPNLFTITWIFLIIGISIKTSKGKLIYIISFIISLILFLVNNVYYSMTDSFFGFSLLGLASEGSTYLIDAILNCNIRVYISLIIIIFTFFYSIKYYPKETKTN